MRKFIITAVWIFGAAILIAPYFVGRAANENFIHLVSLPWPYTWALGFLICGCLAVGLLFTVMLWPISMDIADWAEKKFK